MGFRKRRDKRSEAVKSGSAKDGSVRDGSVRDGSVRDGSVRDGSVRDTAEFRHSSGATNLEGLLGEHTLDEAAEAAAPKGYRARSIAKSEPRR